MRRLIWTLVVVAVLALVLDRGGRIVAERVVARNLAAEEDLAREPSVDIAGFPFLTQFARGRYQRVTATAGDLRIGKGDRRVTLSRVAFTFHRVSTNRDFTRFHARTGEAAALISYRELGTALDLGIRYDGAGKVRVTKRVVLAGQSFAPSFVVEPSQVSGALALTNATLAGDVPPAAAQVVQRLLRIDLPLDGLPFDVRVDSVRATADGVVLRLSGKDLLYRQ